MLPRKPAELHANHESRCAHCPCLPRIPSAPPSSPSKCYTRATLSGAAAMRGVRFAIMMLMLLQGCGLKGPLYLPTEQQKRDTAERQRLLKEREARRQGNAVPQAAPPAETEPAPQAKRQRLASRGRTTPHRRAPADGTGGPASAVVPPPAVPPEVSLDAPSGFSRHGGELHAEQVPLSALAERFGTPCFVYSRAALERAFASFERAFGARPHLICYAAKANSSLAILNLFARLGSGFDIVSGGELERVIAAGGDPGKVVFSGVGKRSDEIELALAKASCASTWNRKASCTASAASLRRRRYNRAHQLARQPRGRSQDPSVYLRRG